MADFNSKFSYESDFSGVVADIKNLVKEATYANTIFAQLNKTAASVKTEAARSFAGQAGFAGFKAQVVDLTGATENFGQALSKNKLTMKEYFKEASQAYKKDSKAYQLALREVKRSQSAVIAMGDVNGKRKGLLLTPDNINMNDVKTKLAVANKQYEIFNDLVNKGATSLVNWGKNTQWAGRQLTVGLTVPMGLFSQKALAAFSEVDKEITRFKKVYGSDLTGTVTDSTDEMLAQIQGLGAEFAKQYGIASAQTIALAADLAAAGMEGQNLANAVNQTTRMMVLGEVDRQTAMTATLSIQNAFNQSSKELAQSIDFLNAVENSTSASLQDLTEAIPKAGPVIKSLGGDIKDLSILMTAMREGGISAGEGANALKSGMASLISPTTKAIEVARQFGIDLQGVVNRNKGELMPMLLDFQEQLRGLDDFGKAKLIEEIFGKYQFARISALFDNLNQRGSQTIGMVGLMKQSADDLAKKSYSELKAQENAPSTRLAAMQTQLTEQLVKVGAEIASSVLPALQQGLDILSKIVEGFNNLPGPIKSFSKILLTVTAISGPLLMLAGMFGNLIGNAMKFTMTVINMFKRITGHPVQQLQILTDEELAAKLAADQLTGAYARQKTSVDALNKSMATYIESLRMAASVAPPGVITPGKPIRPVRRQTGGPIHAKDGYQLSGYGGGDKVPALLEPGEFVVRKEAVKKYGPIIRSMNDGSVQGFQEGGSPGASIKSMLQGVTGTDKKRSFIYDGIGGTGKKVDSVLAGIKDPALKAELEKVLSLSSTSLETHKLAYGASPMYHNKWALSHSEKTVTPLLGYFQGELSHVFKKVFAGKTFVEPYLYNSYMNNTVSQMISGNQTLMSKVAKEFPDIARMISDERVPMSKSEVSRMIQFLENPEISKSLYTESAFNQAARKNTLDYLKSLDKMSNIEFSRAKKLQHLTATISAMPKADFNKVFSYTDDLGKNIKMSQAQVIEAMMSDKPHPNSKISGIQKSYGRTFEMLLKEGADTERINKRLTIIASKIASQGDLPVLNARGAKAMAAELEARGSSFVGSGQLKAKDAVVNILDKSSPKVKQVLDDVISSVIKKTVAGGNKQEASKIFELFSIAGRIASRGKLPGYKNGGIIFANSGGKLPGFGGGDKVPAMLEPGEFIVNKNATKNNLGLLHQINGGPGNTSGYGKFAIGGMAMKMFKNVGKGKFGIGDLLNAYFGVESAKNIASGEGGMMDYMFAAMAAPTLFKTLKMGATGLTGKGKLVSALSASQKTASAMSAKGLAPEAIKAQSKRQAAAKAGGGFMGKVASSLAGRGMLTGIAKLGLRAIPVVGTLATIYEIGNMIRDWKVEQWVNQLKDVYGEATEMAKVYNIELNKTGKALKENMKQTRSLGQAAAIVGKGQVEKDYEAAVSKDYGEAIERIKGLATEQEKANTLTEVYTSLLTQGFSTEQAKEITAEIARQAQATGEFNAAWESTLKNIKTAEEAMGVLVSSVQTTIKYLGTAEEKAAAFVGAYNNLLRMSAESPIEFGTQVATLVNTDNLDPESLKQGIDQILGDMGYANNEAVQGAFSNLNFATEAGRESAALFMRALAAGIDPSMLDLPPVVLEVQVNINEGARQAKIELNSQMQDYIGEIEDEMAATNAFYDDKIAAIQKEKDALQDAHEGRMKQFEAEAEALNDRKDQIGDNTDYYLELLQKEYDAEQYYNEQRKTGLDGLSALAKGDLFGFIQAQNQQASDAQQFGREEAMKQIEDTRDKALDAIDAQLKMNQKASEAAGDALQEDLDNADKRIENLNIKRSNALKGMQDLIDKAQEIIDMEVGDVTSADLQQLETKATEVANVVPPKIKTALEAASVNLVEDFDKAIANAATELANAYGLSQGDAQNLYAAIIGGFAANIPGSTGATYQAGGFGNATITVQGIGTVDPYGGAGSSAAAGGMTKKYSSKSTTGNPMYDVFDSSGKKIGTYPFIGKVNNIPVSQIPGFNKGGMVYRFGKGNIVPGFGSTDTVPAMLTPGEFVINKKATADNLPLLQAINSGGRVGYNMGGMVGGSAPEYNMPENSSARVVSVMNSNANVKTNNLNMPVNISVTSNDPQQAANLVVKEFRRVQRSMENRFRG